jgi:hypothetical protein
MMKIGRKMTKYDENRAKNDKKGFKKVVRA